MKLQKFEVYRFSAAEVAVFGVPEQKRNTINIRLYASDVEVERVQTLIEGIVKAFNGPAPGL